MATQVVEDFPKIPESIDIKDWMWNCRRNMEKDILPASVLREEYCSICGQKSKPKKDKIWIQCELCQRWFHVNCLNIVVPSKDQSWLCFVHIIYVEVFIVPVFVTFLSFCYCMLNA
ncbi:hypothetical protein Q7C36_005195 [Tachysurus vachellii]|uniref:PHD-type domain-containing protein n=1 Tax=Tachysurus vachellii TaxID=175792 RepID=A0AA88NNJ2_TACVA|nr:hypothetical protein Q7C36_005195 [Tachysurus vachellii]